MNRLLYLGYLAAGAGAALATRLASADGGKLTRSLAARRHVLGRLAAWGARSRDARRPLLWMHAPSVGEGLQARPVLELVRSRRPDVQLAYTFFSPSAESFARSLPVDVCDYLPFDTPQAARQLLDALRPTALVYAKLDVWPILTMRAHLAGTRLGLVSATLAPRSSRRRGLARALLTDAYAALDAVGAVDPDDAGRLSALGVRAQAIRVTGDTRYDQVAARATAVDRASALLAPFARPRPTLVAGSTWPADEAVLLPAWEAVRQRVPNARLIIAAHEPTEPHLARIEAWARALGVAAARLGARGQECADVVVVDRVGVLGDLYAVATAAFVGGGFHAAGLHSVLEPAAFGAPVAFGPRHGSARDAMLLHEAGGGEPVRDVAQAAECLVRWLGTASAREDAGSRAREVVARGTGAAERSYELVSSLLPPAPTLAAER